MAAPIERAGDPPSPKRRAILAGAREVFMEAGFERASVDLIAARAGVSKATVYNHFQDKDALFVASLSEEADGLRAGFLACLSEPRGEVEPALRRVGEKLLAVLLSPTVVALYRQASAESVRFPALGRRLFERGPVLVNETLAAYLARWEEKGALRLGDARSAAVHFGVLCQGNLFLRAQLGELTHPSDGEVRETVERGVSAFLRAYRP